MLLFGCVSNDSEGDLLILGWMGWVSVCGMVLGSGVMFRFLVILVVSFFDVFCSMVIMCLCIVGRVILLSLKWKVVVMWVCLIGVWLLKKSVVW